MVVLLVEKNIRILMYFFKVLFYVIFIYFDCYFNRGCRKISRENGY